METTPVEGGANAAEAVGSVGGSGEGVSDTNITTAPGAEAPSASAVVEESFDLNSIFKKVESKTENQKLTPYDPGLVEKLLAGSKSNNSGKEASSVEEAESGDAEGEKGEGEAKTDRDKLQAPVVKFKIGEKEVEVPESAIIKVSVNGKEEDVSVADLRRDYQGRVPWNEHYRQLREDRKSFDAEKSNWQAQKKAEAEAFDHFLELAKTDPWAALVEAAIAKGENPAVFLPRYLAQAKKTTEDLLSLSQEDVDRIVREKSVEYKERILQKKEKITQEQQERADADAAMIKYISTKQREYNIPDAEMIAAYEFLASCDNDPKHPFKFGKDATELSKVDSVIHYITDFARPHSRIESIVKSIDPNLVGDRAFLIDVKRVTLDTYPDMGDDEIKEIVSGVLAKSAPPKQSATVQASSSKDLSTGTPTRPTPEKTPQREVVRTEGKVRYNPRSMEDIIRHYKNNA